MAKSQGTGTDEQKNCMLVKWEEGNYQTMRIVSQSKSVHLVHCRSNVVEQSVLYAKIAKCCLFLLLRVYRFSALYCYVFQYETRE